MRKLLAISALCLCALPGCTTTSERVVIVPDDRLLEEVYDKDGRLLVGRTSISDGYLHELVMDLSRCAKKTP